MVGPNSHHLQKRVDEIYDHLYANATTRTPAGICTEVGKILHSGMFFEGAKEKFPAFNFNRQEIRDFLSQEKEACHRVASHVRKAFTEMNASWKLYEPASDIDLNDFNIAYSVAKLNGLYLSDPKRDVFGDVIEIIRSNWAKRIGGQFFTDQIVTSLAMTLLNFDPRHGDDLVDICAGTGGFLLAGMNHIRTILEKKSNGNSVEEEVIRLSLASLKGLEVDGEIAGLANASLKARLGTKRGEFVTECDSLNLHDLNRNSSNIKLDTHLCTASNPPFGTKITVKDPNILRNFDLSVTPSRFSSSLLDGMNKMTPRAPDILFLEQNIRLLLPGRGRAAIVLPYQILSGPQTFFVREWLMRQVRILAIVDLPAETFQPHTGTKTALLVVKRREVPLADPREDDQGNVFMAMPRWIGHDRRGHPIFKKNADGSLSGEILCDFEQVKTAYEAYLSNDDPREVYERCFLVEYSNIVRDSLLRINALFHRPLNGNVGGIPESETKTKSGWEKKKLRDVVKNIFYPGRFKRNYTDWSPEAVPFLGGSNITEMLATTNKFLSPNDPKLQPLRVEAGWILVTRSGSTGIVSSVPQAWDGFAMSEHVIRIVPDSSKLDPHYIEAFLRTDHAQESIKRGVFGSVIDEITPEFIGDIDILVPKSGKLFKEVNEKVCRAQKARQEAIDGYVQAIDQLNSLFGKFK